MNPHLLRRGLLALATGAWACAVAAGFLIWDRVEAKPGTVGRTPSARSPGQPSVVVFVHPHCPCTRAALPELLAAVSEAPAGSVRVVFVRPAGVPEGWERARSWEIASAAVGVEVAVDPDGVEAATEGAETSGYAVARGASGRVAYRGGIGRRHANANPGLRAVVDVLAGRIPPVEEAPVFGCALRDE